MEARGLRPCSPGVRGSVRAAIVWGHIRAMVGSSLGGSGKVGLQQQSKYIIYRIPTLPLLSHCFAQL